MPTNDPVNDSYNPPGNRSFDFETFKFSELEEEELFWRTNSQNESTPFRKVNLGEGINIKTQQVQAFSLNEIVYQRT